MFATLVGTDTDTRDHERVFGALFALAVARGFAPPVAPVPIVADQASLARWKLAQTGPANGTADFLLSVCAPRVPTIAPLPVRKTVAGPLFAVVVLPRATLVRHDFMRDVVEVEERSAVDGLFASFLDRLAAPLERPRGG